MEGCPILKYGVVSDTSRPGYVKVTFAEDDFPTDFLPVLVSKSKTDKQSWPLEVNEHVVCLMLDDCDDGVVLGAIPSEVDSPDPGEAAGKFRIRFSDNTVLEYDKNGHKLTVDVKGDVDVIATGDVTVDAGGAAKVSAMSVEVSALADAKIKALQITLDGVVTVTGALMAASISTTGGGAITAGGSLTASGEISAAKVSAGGIDLASHKHVSAPSGSLTGPAVP